MKTLWVKNSRGHLYRFHGLSSNTAHLEENWSEWEFGDGNGKKYKHVSHGENINVPVFNVKYNNHREVMSMDCVVNGIPDTLIECNDIWE